MEKLALFHRKYFLSLVRRAMLDNGLSPEDAHDVVQQTFLLAMTKLDPNGNPKAWLKKVVDTFSMNLLRTRGRRAKIAARWGLGAEYAAEPETMLVTDQEE